MNSDDTQYPARRGILNWLIDHPKTVATLLILLTLILSVFLVDRSIHGQVMAKLAALQARGEPISVADLNAMSHRVSKAENTLPEILEEIRKIEAVKIPADEEKFVPVVGRALPTPTGCSWTQEQRKAVSRYLDSNKSELARIRQLASTDRVQLSIYWTSPLILVTIPEYSEIRTAVKVLCLEALNAAACNDRESASRILVEMAPLTHCSGEDTVLIGSLVDIACAALYEDTIERTLNQCGMSESALLRIEEQLKSLESVPDMRRGFMNERVIVLDALDALRLGKLTPGASAMPASLQRIPILPTMNSSKFLDIYGSLIDALSVRDATVLGKVNTTEAEVTALPDYYFMIRTLVPSLVRAVELWIRELGSNRALQVGLAAERFRLSQGTWPQYIEDLSPNYLKTIPLDPFDNKPIRYARIPEGIKTWTIGEDIQDDGGDVRRLESYKSGSLPKDCGWVILNPDLRGRPAPVPTTQKSNALTTARPPASRPAP